MALIGPANGAGQRPKKAPSCQRPAHKRNGRCFLHGGKSTTGPKTQEGLARLTAARTIHGKCTKEKRAEAKRFAEQGRQMRAELAELEEWFVDNGHFDKNWRDQF